VIPSLISRPIALAVLAALSAVLLLVSAPAALASGHSDDRFSYILFSEGSRSTTMSGSLDELGRARALRRGNEALLYVRRDGNAWIIRDSATLRRAQAIFEPQQALGARQAALGSRQAALGSRQAALGAEQGRLGRLQSGAKPARQLELGRQQHELGRQQNELGRQQNLLGQQQSALGREQARLAREADVQFRALLEDAIRRGIAQRID
jgi:hypothetical protein